VEQGYETDMLCSSEAAIGAAKIRQSWVTKEAKGFSEDDRIGKWGQKLVEHPEWRKHQQKPHNQEASDLLKQQTLNRQEWHVRFVAV
jgi:hypothetical protein